MGEVYRARDDRLGREVAVKVLPDGAGTPEQVARLEREARATGALNHPNILVVFDVGTEGARPFIVSELLEGQTLRGRIAGAPVAVRKALDIAAQIAEGLAAAHDKGICHRDLKPDNIFLTEGERVKILDFGLAKLVGPVHRSPGGQVWTDANTRSGVILGSTPYMSPEQLRGEEADYRSDIFAFGAVLYEMITGHRAFQGGTAVDVMHAVMHDDPPELAPGTGVALGLAHIVRRCLEKRREDRFQSARDLAFHLEELQGVWAVTHPNVVMSMRERRLWLRIAGGLGAAALIAALTTYFLRPSAAEGPVFRQLTFHRGTVSAARFGPDGRSVLYSAAWEGQPSELRLALVDAPEARPLGFPGARLLAVSAAGDMALLLRPRHSGAERLPGTLARVPVAGGAPREMADDVEEADWVSGDDMMAVRSSGANAVSTLELPLGRAVYTSSGAIRNARARPGGEEVAFLDDAAGFGIGGAVSLIDRAGARRSLTRRFANARGLAWDASGREIWFTAADEGEARALWAVSAAGTLRLVARAPGSLTIHDVSPSGRALLTVDAERRGILGTAPGAAAEREMSWFDRSGLADLSPDGKWLLFGDRRGVYLRDTSGSPAARLGDGLANSLSPDGRWAVATSRAGDRILLFPTGSGQAREVTAPGIVSYEGAWLLQGGEQILFNGHEEGRPMRAYVRRLEGGDARAVTPEGTWSTGLAADRQWMVGTGAGTALSLHPLAGGAPRAIAGSLAGDRPAGWTADGLTLWIFRRSELPVRVERLDLKSGARTVSRLLQPADPAGVVFVSMVRVTPDGSSYAYSYRRVLSDLFVVDGLR